MKNTSKHTSAQHLNTDADTIADSLSGRDTRYQERLREALRKLYAVGQWQRTIAKDAEREVGHAYAQARAILDEGA